MNMEQTENQENHSVSLNELQAYLRLNGWQTTPNRNARLLVYQGQVDDAGNPIQVVLTENESYADTPRRIAEVITTLAELEERPTEQVAQDVAAVNDDVTLWRILEPDGKQSISIGLAAAFIVGLEYLITYSACLEETPLPYFSRATAIGREFVQHCRFGHTRPGSFVFEMESSLTFGAAHQPPSVNTTPFPRRVMQRLVRGLTEVGEATRAANSELLVKSYQDGFNANAYEKLSQMLESIGNGGLEFDCKWAPALNSPFPQSKSSIVRLNVGSVAYLKEAAKTLRQMKPQSGIRLRGRILRLGTDTDGTLRVITLDTTVQGYTRHVRIALQPTDYTIACDAHRDNRPIQVTGNLEKQGHTWRLVDPTEFSLA